jgi:hypothetical protein
MPFRYNRRVSYDEFEARVRRHRPSELVPAIGAVTARQEAEGISPLKDRLTLPWGLAAAAKESLRAGTEDRRSGITARDIQEIAGAYNALADPLLDGTKLGELHSFFTRLTWEQFPYQQSKFEELTRPYAIFKLGADELITEMVDDQFWERALGCSLEQFWGVGFFLSVVAEHNKGFVNLEVLDRLDLQPLFEEVPATTIESVLKRHFATSRHGFRMAANAARSTDARLRRFDYNPLLAKPFVEWGERVFLAPVSHLVLRRVSTSGMYFIGLEACPRPEDKDRFTRDIGELFQAYIGRQLSEMRGADLLPEIVYDAGKRSVDWILIFPKLVLLVEAKSTPLTREAKMGKEKLADDVGRAVGKAYRQIRSSYELIRGGHAAFSKIPTDRPIHGLVVTLEPYFLVNNPLIRATLPDPGIPTQATSSRELEHLIAISAENSVMDFFLETMTHEERRTWDISASLGDRTIRARNRLLDAAWNHFPWRSFKG